MNNVPGQRARARVITNKDMVSRHHQRRKDGKLSCLAATVPVDWRHQPQIRGQNHSKSSCKSDAEIVFDMGATHYCTFEH
jgi:hypothetical protein